MKKIIIALFSIIYFSLCAFADNISEAEKLLKKAVNGNEESYEYINQALELYQKSYEDNPADIKVLLGLSKTYQLIGDRAQAKLYVLKAYNSNPIEPKLQKAMGDFYFSFQEYSTALEYYKLALASGLLKDYETNLLTAKCFEKLGDIDNAELYYKISYHFNHKSDEALEKINEFYELKHPDPSKEAELKHEKFIEAIKTESEVQNIINKLSF